MTTTTRQRVLFLRTGNSARSQLAEGRLRGRAVMITSEIAQFSWRSSCEFRPKTRSVESNGFKRSQSFG